MLEWKFWKRLIKPKPLPSTAEILKNPDLHLRRSVASRHDAPADILCVLAADADAGIRRVVAANPSAPAILSPILAKDSDVDVRSVLMKRLVKLLPGLSTDQKNELYRSTVKALETLARDQVVLIREALAATLKDVTFAPLSVVRCLAEDVEQRVAEPILQLCTSLTDEDLLEIIVKNPNSWALAAIAGRKGVSAKVSGAIAASRDAQAGSILLDNHGAIIEETTLADMIENAAEIPEWHKKLAARPNLPRKLAVKLAEYVDRSVMQTLQKRRDFDAETAQEVVSVTRRRLHFIDAMSKTASGADRAVKFYQTGKLNEITVLDAISWHDKEFVVAALAVMSKVPFPIVESILATRSGKVITALAWRAGLSMRTAMQIQTRIAKVPQIDFINARHGDKYPLTEEQMLWQLNFMGAIPDSQHAS